MRVAESVIVIVRSYAKLSQDRRGEWVGHACSLGHEIKVNGGLTFTWSGAADPAAVLLLLGFGGRRCSSPSPSLGRMVGVGSMRTKEVGSWLWSKSIPSPLSHLSWLKLGRDGSHV